MASSMWELVTKSSPGSSKFRLFILAFVFTFGLLSYGSYHGLTSSNLAATTQRCEEDTDLGQHSNCSADPGVMQSVELTINDDMKPPSPSSSPPSSPSTKHIINGIDVFPPPPPADDEEYMAICRSSRNSPKWTLLTAP